MCLQAVQCWFWDGDRVDAGRSRPCSLPEKEQWRLQVHKHTHLPGAPVVQNMCQSGSSDLQQGLIKTSWPSASQDVHVNWMLGLFTSLLWHKLCEKKKHFSLFFRCGFSYMEVDHVPSGIYNVIPTTFLPKQEGPFFLDFASTSPLKVSQLQWRWRMGGQGLGERHCGIFLEQYFGYEEGSIKDNGNAVNRWIVPQLQWRNYRQRITKRNFSLEENLLTCCGDKFKFTKP